MLKNRFIIINLVILAFLTVGLHAEDYLIKQFAGPPHGKTYIYENSNGHIRLEVSGIKCQKSNILQVVETRYFAFKELPDGMPNKNKITYRLKILNDEIIKEFRGKKQIMLKYNGSVESINWNADGIKVLPEKNVVVPVPIKCKLIEKKQKNIFGGNRIVLTKECIHKDVEGSYLTVEQYAAGIGLIEETSFFIDNKGRKSQINSFSLKEIRRE